MRFQFEREYRFSNRDDFGFKEISHRLGRGREIVVGRGRLPPQVLHPLFIMALFFMVYQIRILIDCR